MAESGGKAPLTTRPTGGEGQSALSDNPLSLTTIALPISRDSKGDLTILTKYASSMSLTSRPRTIAPPSKIDSSGALQAAAIAASQKRTTSTDDRAAYSHNQSVEVFQKVLADRNVGKPGNSTSEQDLGGLTLAKTGDASMVASRSTMATRSAALAAKASIRQNNVISRSEKPQSLAHASTSTSRATPTTHTSSTPQSLAAAQFVAANRSSYSTSLLPQEVHANSKFGVILSRPVSPAQWSDLGKPNRPNNLPTNSAGTLYQLPQATISAPVLFLDRTEIAHHTGSRRPPELLQNPFSSSGSGDLPTGGATTAMSSRCSSQPSIPTLIAKDHNSGIQGSPNPQKRPAHLKTTMRKISHQNQGQDPKHEGKNNGGKNNGSQTLSKIERKRYEGVWAANRPRIEFSSSHQKKSYIENFVVRELWNRSRLPPEGLAHIW